MNLDPTGSPRHEQTVAVALEVIIAWGIVMFAEIGWSKPHRSNYTDATWSDSVRLVARNARN
jgi:hypothetical protein